MCEKTYFCGCGDFSSSDYESLEDHIVSHSNNRNAGHYYLGVCCSCGCETMN